MGTKYYEHHIKTNGFSRIFIFANVWLFDDILNVYEFQEKQNIEYYWGRKSNSEDFHDDWRGSQGENIEYQQGRTAKVYVFHGLRKGGDGQSANKDKGRSSSPPDPQSKKDMET